MISHFCQLDHRLTYYWTRILPYLSPKIQVMMFHWPMDILVYILFIISTEIQGIYSNFDVILVFILQELYEFCANK